MEFMFFVAENSKADHASSQGVSRKTRKNESTKRKNGQTFVIDFVLLGSGLSGLGDAKQEQTANGWLPGRNRIGWYIDLS